MELNDATDEELRFELESRGYLVMVEADIDRTTNRLTHALNTKSIHRIANEARDYIQEITGKFYVI